MWKEVSIFWKAFTQEKEHLFFPKKSVTKKLTHRFSSTSPSLSSFSVGTRQHSLQVLLPSPPPQSGRRSSPLCTSPPPPLAAVGRRSPTATATNLLTLSAAGDLSNDSSPSPSSERALNSLSSPRLSTSPPQLSSLGSDKGGGRFETQVRFPAGEEKRGRWTWTLRGIWGFLEERDSMGGGRS